MTDVVVDGLAQTLRALPPCADDAARIDRIRALEELKSAAAALQAQETVAFAASQRAQQLAVGVPAERADRGIAAQIALARRVSPHQARRYVGWTAILTRELPETYAALRAGSTSEWRATITARETAWLSREHRRRVDAQLGPRLGSMGDRAVEAEARTLAYRLDPQGAVDRTAAAERERRVTLRPAPDTMARLTALLPVAQGVAAWAALRRAADTAVAQGDNRGHGQLMADTLVGRLTGQQEATGVPVEINLVMPSETLLGSGDEPAVLIGHGPIPAAYARRLALGDGRSPRWIRRLFRAPQSGELVAVESRRRLFTAGQRRFVELRDQGRCRTPWCDAPIRPIDHVVATEYGGATEVGNAQGLCAACNYAKQAPRWRLLAFVDGRVQIHTPTGHTYEHAPPQVPGAVRSVVVTGIAEAHGPPRAA